MNAVAIPESALAARFTKIGADGSVLPRDAAEWEAVLDSRTGLMWPVQAIAVDDGREATINAAVAKCRTAGFDDWRAPTVEELFLLADRSRVSPAIDTEFFPDCPSDWFWTSTPDCESPEDYAWFVYFSYGFSFRGNRDGGGFVRAVRVGQ